MPTSPKTKRMTVSEYAAFINKSPQAVRKALNPKAKKKQPILSRVASFEKVGYVYILEVIS